MAADTSSAAAGGITVVAGAADALASLIASPIPLKSADAAAKASGAAIRKDDILGSRHLRATQPRNRSSRKRTNRTPPGIDTQPIPQVCRVIAGADGVWLPLSLR